MALYSGGDAGKLVVDDAKVSSNETIPGNAIMPSHDNYNGQIIGNGNAILDIGIAFIWSLSGDE